MNLNENPWSAVRFSSCRVKTKLSIPLVYILLFHTYTCPSSSRRPGRHAHGTMPASQPVQSPLKPTNHSPANHPPHQSPESNSSYSSCPCSSVLPHQYHINPSIPIPPPPFLRRIHSAPVTLCCHAASSRLSCPPCAAGVRALCGPYGGGVFMGRLHGGLFIVLRGECFGSLFWRILLLFFSLVFFFYFYVYFYYVYFINNFTSYIIPFFIPIILLYIFALYFIHFFFILFFFFIRSFFFLVLFFVPIIPFFLLYFILFLCSFLFPFFLVVFFVPIILFFLLYFLFLYSLVL